MQNPSVLEEAEGITKKFDHRSENWMKFDTFSSFWNIIQTPAASAGPAAVGRRVFFTLLLWANKLEQKYSSSRMDRTRISLVGSNFISFWIGWLLFAF